MLTESLSAADFKYSCSTSHRTLEVGLFRGKRTKAEARGFENTVTMTIDVVFMAKNKVMLRIIMGVTNFYCKIVRELTTELEVSLRKTHTNKKLIQKVWCICVHYGCISENYDVTELDAMKFQMIMIVCFPVSLNKCLWCKHVVERYCWCVVVK